jgi:DNA-binding transcriptional MerR regulator
LNKAPNAFRTISEVAEELDLPQHVLRFWESRFAHIKPMKRGGGRRYYRPEDIDLLRGIRHLLYGDGYTIRGVQRILREQGVRTVQSVGQGLLSLPEPAKEEPETANAAPELPFPNAAPDAQNDQQDQDQEDEEVEQPPPAARPTQAQRGDALPAAASSDPPSSRPPPPAPRAPASASADSAPAEKADPLAYPTHPAAQPTRAPLDLDRLKAALAEIEACRRLLDRALDDE